METSFRVPQILGILQVRPALRDLSVADRMARARQCVDFARLRASWRLRTPATLPRSGGGGPNHQQLPLSPDHNGRLINSMVPLQPFNSLVESSSNLAGQEALLTINDTGVTLKLTRCQNRVLTCHLGPWLAVLWLSHENELVYIGQEKETGLRIAVVLQMMSLEDGLCVLEINNSRLNQQKPEPVLQRMTNPEHVDPFYVNVGFSSEEQERLYHADVSLRYNTKNTDNVSFQNHLINFIKNEIKYCLILRNLIQLRNGLKDVQVSHELRHWDRILKTHEDLNLKRFISTRNLTAGSVSDCLSENTGNLECYIDYIRETSSIESVSLLKFNNFQEVRENVVSTRKRIFHYFSNLETWLKFTANAEEEEKIKKAIGMLKTIYKTADSFLILDSVKKCPYNLNLYFPLLKHGMFTVVGKNFKKEKLYKLLLFEDLLVFTESSYGLLNCFEAFRLEHIVLLPTREGSVKKHTIKLEINHGERRGKEIIRVVGRKEELVKQWEEDIMHILTRLSQRIKPMYSSETIHSSGSGS